MSKKIYKLFGPTCSYAEISFEVGKTYIFDGELSIHNGFTATSQLSSFLSMVDLVEDIFYICEVELLGTVLKDRDILVTDRLKIVKQLSNEDIDNCFKKQGIFIIPEYNKTTKKFEYNFLNDLKTEKKIFKPTKTLKDNYYHVS